MDKLLRIFIIMFCISLGYVNAAPITPLSLPSNVKHALTIANHFSWEDSKTIPTHSQLKTLEAAALTSQLNKQTMAELSNQEKYDLAEINLKLGMYYTHVLKNPDLAINKLSIANQLLKKAKAKAWIFNHLAYAYELKYAETKNSDDKRSALYFSNKVISKFPPDSNEVAFAYSVKGLVANDAYDYTNAEKNFLTALTIYEKNAATQTEPYIRSKNRLASIILDQHGREQEVLSMLTPLKRYWMNQKNFAHNPYAARTFITIGQAYLKIGKGKSATLNFKKALNIYARHYGESSTQLFKLYDLLAQSYKLQGKNKLAAKYTRKLAELR